MARPTILTRELIQQIADLVRKCLYIETACNALGLHRVTIHRWVKAGAREARRRVSGQKPDRKLDLQVELCNAYKKAMAMSEVSIVDALQHFAHNPKCWQAGAWLLERRNPDHWSSDRKRIRELEKKFDELEKAGVYPPPAREVENKESKDGKA